MKYFMIPIMGVTVAMLSGSVLAAPSVSGNTISWPDDGWYQVQSKDGSETFCNGGQSCEVPPGTYLVINHNSGERFNNILVEGSGSGVTVSGNTISWPDDGWYQVQSKDGSETFCNGGQSCEVPPGTYLVINHNSGERFNNIKVGASDGEENNVTPEDQALFDDLPHILNSSMMTGFFYRGRDLASSVRNPEYLVNMVPDLDDQTGVLNTGEQILFDERYHCPEGGIFFYNDTSPGGSSSLTNEGYYSDCIFGDSRLNGRYKYSSDPGFFRSQSTYDLVAKWPDEAIEMVDILTIRDYTTAYARGAKYNQMNDARDVVVLENFNFRTKLDEDTEENLIRFHVTRGTFNDGQYVFSGGTSTELVLNDDATGVIAGYIAFDFEDGRRLTIEPSADPHFYRTTLRRADGALVEKTLSWSDVTLNIARE